ncbi:MAG TPA: glycosyltransferase family 1 protein [Opitutales bacterium]|nr:glycosyltransferase family 1 protein [Opitutales bacterium]
MELENKLNVLLVANYLPDRQRSMLRFAEQLKQGLKVNGIEAEFFHPPVAFGRLLSGNTGLAKWLGYIDKYLIAPISLRRRLRKMATCRQVVHICDHSNAIYTSVLGRTPHLLTCHDLLAVRSALGEIPANRPKWTGRQQQRMILKGLKQSRTIVSVSEATRRDVDRLVGDRRDWQYLVPNSLDDDFIEEARSAIGEDPGPLPLAGYTEGMRYIIHVGGEKWYKNRKAVLRIFAQLQENANCLRLVVVGPRFSDPDLEATGCRELKDKIHYLRDVSDGDLRALYKRAEMLLFPSLMEGFGWPILEAQACGCPVATLAIEPMSSLNALPELCVHADTSDPNGITRFAEVCQHQLTAGEDEKTEQKQKIKNFAAGFSNRASAEAYIKIYKRLLGESADS